MTNRTNPSYDIPPAADEGAFQRQIAGMKAAEKRWRAMSKRRERKTRGSDYDFVQWMEVSSDRYQLEHLRPLQLGHRLFHKGALAVEFSHPDYPEKKDIVSRVPQPGRKSEWRVTNIWSDGLPGGHAERKTLLEALQEVDHRMRPTRAAFPTRQPEFESNPAGGGSMLYELKEGTLLYHGTQASEEFDVPDGPAWFSDDREVADRFKTWHSHGGGERPRVLAFRVERSANLAPIRSERGLHALLEECGTSPYESPNDWAEAVCTYYDGWIVFNNYGDAHDIMLCDPESHLERVVPEQSNPVAYHGTANLDPYERFDMSKVGAAGGEGKQAFGHGLYFASQKEVAQFYAGQASGVVGAKSEEKRDALRLLALKDASPKEFAQYLDGGESYMGRIAERIKSGRIRYKGGKVYKADIPSSSQLLQMDKALTKQPKPVKELLKRSKIWSRFRANQQDMSTPSASRRDDGQGVYGYLTLVYGSEAAASDVLRRIGIPGMEYPSGTLSGARTEGRNYVMFDDSAIEILSHNPPKGCTMQTNPSYEDRMRKEYGVTDYPDTAFYILPDGDFLSGDEGGGMRSSEHRGVSYFLPPKTHERLVQGGSRTDAMYYLMRRAGLIRWIPEGWAAQLVQAPTSDQARTLKRLVSPEQPLRLILTRARKNDGKLYGNNLELQIYDPWEVEDAINNFYGSTRRNPAEGKQLLSRIKKKGAVAKTPPKASPQAGPTQASNPGNYHYQTFPTGRSTVTPIPGMRPNPITTEALPRPHRIAGPNEVIVQYDPDREDPLDVGEEAAASFGHEVVSQEPAGVDLLWVYHEPARRNPAGGSAMSLSEVNKWVPEAKKRGVSKVARSSRGFVAALRKAGSVGKLSEKWQNKRKGFIARHMAQASDEDLWQDGKPSDRALALMMWAFKPSRRNPGRSAETYAKLVSPQGLDIIEYRKQANGRFKRTHRYSDGFSWGSTYTVVSKDEVNREAKRLKARKWKVLAVNPASEETTSIIRKKGPKKASRYPTAQMKQVGPFTVIQDMDQVIVPEMDYNKRFGNLSVATRRYADLDSIRRISLLKPLKRR